MKYTLKVWLFTVLMAPLLLLTLGIMTYFPKLNEIWESWPILLCMIAYGLVLSAPAMVLFWLLHRKLIKTQKTNSTKLILSSYAFASVWITFYIFDSSFLEDGFPQLSWVLIYSLTITAAVWLFRLHKIQTIKNNIPDDNSQPNH